jgi:hypothetical protein
VVKTLALVSFIHYYAMSATTAHRFAEYNAVATRARLSAYVAHAIQWTFSRRWPRPFCCWRSASRCGCSGRNSWSATTSCSSRRSACARAAIGPVERLLNMLGHQHIVRWPMHSPSS